MTAPTQNRLQADPIKPHERKCPIALTDEIAVERLMSLRNVSVAQGALPAL